MAPRLEETLDDRLIAITAAMGEGFITVTKERQYRMIDGKEAPNGHVFRLFMGKSDKVAPVAVGRGTPRPVLEALDEIEARPDVVLGFAEYEVQRAAGNLNLAKEWYEDAVKARAAAEKAAKAAEDASLAEVAETAATTDEPEPAPGIAGVGTELVKVENNVRAVYVDGDAVGEVAKIANNKWQIITPFSPTTYKSMKAAVAALTD